jgi:anti-sigma B factor antagonist
MKFDYEIEEENNLSVIFFQGNLIEKYEAENVLADVAELITEGKSNFIIDFKDFEYLNSSGLNVILNILTKSRIAGGETVICEVPDKLKKLFIITKLDAVFTQTISLEEARNKFNQHKQPPIIQ